MALDRLQFLKALEDSYSAYYNIRKNESKIELPLIFEADFFKRDERYWFTKGVKYYGNETNEFVYVFSEENFSKDLSDACIRYAIDDGLPRVKPHKEHQYTNIKVIFVAESLDEDAENDIASRRFQKSYHLQRILRDDVFQTISFPDGRERY